MGFDLLAASNEGFVVPYPEVIDDEQFRPQAEFGSWSGFLDRVPPPLGFDRAHAPLGQPGNGEFRLADDRLEGKAERCHSVTQ